LYFDKTYAAKSPKITLKTVAQKLVTSESCIAKIASGAVNAAQNFASPLLVPNIKIEAKGSKMSGIIRAIIAKTLNGFIRSKPRVCRRLDKFALIGFLIEK
jgi:hypothetical protein